MRCRHVDRTVSKGSSCNSNVECRPKSSYSRTITATPALSHRALPSLNRGSLCRRRGDDYGDVAAAAACICRDMGSGGAGDELVSAD